MTPADKSDAQKIATTLNNHHICTDSGCRWAAFQNGSNYVVLLNGTEGSSVAYNSCGVIPHEEYKALATIFAKMGMKPSDGHCQCAQTDMYLENCATINGARPRIGGLKTREGINRDLNWLHRNLGAVKHQLAIAKAAPSGNEARTRLNTSLVQGLVAQHNR